MASKVLTAKVKLNVSDAASKLSMLESRIKKIQNAINNNGNRNNLETQLNKQAIAAEKLKQANAKTLVAEEKRKQAIFQTQISEQKLATQKQRTNEATAKTALMQERVATQTQKTAEATTKAQIAEERLNATIHKNQLMIGKYFNTQNQVKGKVSEIVQKTKEWANNQRQVANSLKSTGSLMNSIKGKITGLINTYLGVMGVKAMVQTSDIITGAQNKLNYLNSQDSGGYNEKAFTATQESMDKMYASSQKVRMSYTDMMGNVSKSMTLAGDAFQNNTDNAIRFQEVMAEAYAVGGASAAEMSSSMYQLIQALGAGTLAGDELRSVREGAPLAYKAIEEFAQKVLKTDESLKDLGSQGKITADMVVAAILNAEGASKQLDEAFGHTAQTFSQTWTQIKNSATKAFEPISNMLRDTLNKAIDNGLVQRFEIVFQAISTVIQVAFKAIEKAIIWLGDNWTWLQWIVYAVIAALLVHLSVLAAKSIWTGLVSFWSFLTGLSPLYIWIIVLGVIIAWLAYLGNTVSSLCEFIYTVCMILVQAILMFLTLILVYAFATGTLLMSIPMMIALLVIAVIALLLAVFVKYTAEVVGYAYAICSAIQAICTNISIAWQNMCSGLSQWFWNAIADMLDGCDWLLKGINKIREALGKDPVDIGSIRAKANAAGANGGKSYVSVGDAWDSGYNKGYTKGESIHNTINSWGEKLKGLTTGLDFGGLTGIGTLPNASNPAYSVDGAYKQPDLSNLGGDVGDIKGNTGKMADSMELTEDDLKYLRDVANMEWKKEFTTATIKVDMSNYNTVNGDNDLDGIVTKLTDRLYEELQSVADGVYV